MTNNLRAPGAGDVLMAFLGPLVISYAFTVFHHRGVCNDVLNTIFLFTNVVQRYMSLSAGWCV